MLRSRRCVRATDFSAVAWVVAAGALGLLCACAVVPAQEPAPEPAQGIPTLHVSAQLVLVDAAVQLKKTGQTIAGLTPGDFVLTEDGEAQKITSISQDQLPLSIVLLFDLTDTVHPVLLHLSGGAAEVLRHLRPQDEVAVMSFSSHATVVQPFTRDRMTAVEGIDSASASYDEHEPTFLFEDLWAATEQSGRSRVRDARRVQIWLSDGSANDQDSERGLSRYWAQHAPAQLHSEQQATDALLQSGTVLSALIERSQIPLTTGRMGDLQRLAALTGGPVVNATASDVNERLASLLDGLRQRYTLGYRPGSARPEGTVCHLKLALSPEFFAAHPEIRPKDVSIRSRQSYVRQTPTHETEPRSPVASPTAESPSHAL